jgi:hypothetical protein
MKKLSVVLLLVAVFVARASSDTPPDPRAEFTFARVQFNMDFRALEDREAPWHHDYPYSEDFYLTMLSEVTGIHTSTEAYKIVHFDDADVFQYPFLYVSEPGFMDLTEAEIKGVREYLKRGGFLFFDDFRGRDLNRLREQMKLVFPQREMFRLQTDHEIFHSFYDMETLEMQAPYSDYRFNGGPEFWGMNDDKGRLIMIGNHNNDFGEYWEWLDRGDRALAPGAQATRFGINYLVYAMTH